MGLNGGLMGMAESGLDATSPSRFTLVPRQSRLLSCIFPHNAHPGSFSPHPRHFPFLPLLAHSLGGSVGSPFIRPAGPLMVPQSLLPTSRVPTIATIALLDGFS